MRTELAEKLLERLRQDEMEEGAHDAYAPVASALAEEVDARLSFDTEGKAVAYVYGLEERELAAAGHLRLTKDEARRVAANIAKLPGLLNADPS